MKVYLVLKIMFQFQPGSYECVKRAIAHRDLKPENIFISENITAVIGDLGLAEEKKQETLESKSKEQIGTVRFMSPKVLSNRYCKS